MMANTTLKQRGRRKEFHVAPVFEKELKMFGVESKLMDRPANLIGHRGRCRGPRPAIAAARMFELQMAAVTEVQLSLSECRIYRVKYDVCSGVFREIHSASVMENEELLIPNSCH